MSRPPRRAKPTVLSVAQYRQSADEHSLQINVLEYLSLHAHRDVFWFAIPNAGKRSWRTAKQLQAEGLTAGVADLCIMLSGGRVAWLELKTSRGAQSDDQEVFELICKEIDHPYGLARNLDQAITFLRRVGALKEGK